MSFTALDRVSVQVELSCKELSISYSLIDERELEPIIERIYDSFLDERIRLFGKKRYWLWNYIKAQTYMNCAPDSYLYLKNISNNGIPIIVFFNNGEEDKIYEFYSFHDWVLVIENCYYFEFYITNHFGDYFVSLNHHDCLSICGKLV